MKTNTTLIVFLVIGIVLVVALFLYVLFRENAMAKKVKELEDQKKEVDEVKKLTSTVDATTASRLIQGSKFKGIIQIKTSFNVKTEEEIRYLVSFLSKMTALQVLDLQSIEIGDKGMEALAPALGNMKALQTLNLSNNEIGEKGVEALAPVLKDLNLIELGLSYNGIDEKGAKALAPALGKMTALQVLDLSNNNIDDNNNNKKEIRDAWIKAGKTSSKLLLYNYIDGSSKKEIIDKIKKDIKRS